MVYNATIPRMTSPNVFIVVFSSRHSQNVIALLRDILATFQNPEEIVGVQMNAKIVIRKNVNEALHSIG